MLSGFSCQLLIFMLCPVNIITYIAKDLDKVTQCFESGTYDWDVRATQKCTKEEEYHCLQDEDESNKFYEFCGEYITIPPGKYPTFRRTHTDIIPKVCVGDTYQNQYLKSSQLHNCFKRVKCDRIGQLVCENGSKTEDRRCKCDITKNMVIKIYGDSPSNKMKCCPDTDRSCDCWGKTCDEGEVLNEVYQCVKRCDPNHYRPDSTSDCIPMRSYVVSTPVPETSRKHTTEAEASTSTIASTTLSKHTPKPVEMLNLTTKLFIGFASVITLILLVLLGMYCFCHSPYNALTTGSCNHDQDPENAHEVTPMLTTIPEELQGNNNASGMESQNEHNGVNHQDGVNAAVNQVPLPNEQNQVPLVNHYHGDVTVYNISEGRDMAVGQRAVYKKGNEEANDAVVLDAPRDEGDNSEFSGF